jgi:hypothetical protein
MDEVAIVAVVVGVLVLALLGWYVWQRQRTEALRSRYGPEYERTVTEVGDKRRAESELENRQERVERLDIRPLSAEQRSGYMQVWRAVQTQFVDDPNGTVTDADRLVEHVLRTRGYPISDFDQRAADLSVHHLRVVDNYRAARDIAHRHRRGEATTEDLRQAMVHYRGLFEDLLEDREHEERKQFEARSAHIERVIERAAERGDRMEIPVKRAGERVSDRDSRARL